MLSDAVVGNEQQAQPTTTQNPPAPPPPLPSTTATTAVQQGWTTCQRLVLVFCMVAYLTAFSFAITAAFTDFWLEESIDDQSLGVIQQQQQHKQIESALKSATDDAPMGKAINSKFTIDQQAPTGPLLTTTNQTDTTTSANSVTILSSGTTTTIVLDFVVGTDDGIDKGESENELGVEKKRAARIPSAHAIMSPNQEGKFISRNKSNEVEALQQHHNAHKFRFHSGLFQGERHSRVGFNQQPVHPLQSKPANSAEDLASPKAYQSRHEKFYVSDELQRGTSFFSGKQLWLLTVFFTGIGLFWNIVAFALSLLNTIIVDPIARKTVAGPYGMFLWSALSILCYVASLALFLQQFFYSNSNKRQHGDVVGHSNVDSSIMAIELGFSFWLLVTAVGIQLATWPLLFCALSNRCCGDGDARARRGNGRKSADTSMSSVDDTAFLY